MRAHGELELLRRACGLPLYLRRPLGADAAAAAVASRMRQREAAFAAVCERLIYQVPRSPWRQLLAWAGCELGDLRRMAAADGIEATLTRLHAAGVYVTAAELRGQAPLRRGSRELAVTAADFDNPLAAGSIAAATSGSTGPSLPVRYGWTFLAEEAAGEALLFAAHGLDAAVPLAFWMPGPPGIAGLHNLLVHAKLRWLPRRWFSPSAPPERGDGLAHRADRGWRLARRLLPGLGPAPEWLPLERADELARWLADAARAAVPGAAPRRAAHEPGGGGPPTAVLKCFASAAARVAAAAVAAGEDLGGCLVFAGGEPLTAARREALARAGLRVFGRYAATETGFIGGACPAATAGDEMHVYSDRLAVIAVEDDAASSAQGGGTSAGLGGNAARAGGADGEPMDTGAAGNPGDLRGRDAAGAQGRSSRQGALAFTTLSLAAPKVLLNAELGDHGTLLERRCGCALGRAGLIWQVSGVHSPAKLAAEGVKLGEADFARLAEEAVSQLGGMPDDVQIWIAEAGAGGSRITVALAPDCRAQPDAVAARLRDRLPALRGGALAARLWFEGGALTVERRPLRPGPGHKLPRVVREPGGPDVG